MAQNQRCVQLSVQPSRALMDEKFKVLVQNAPPEAELTVHSHLQSEDKHSWEAFGHYISDSTGILNLCEDPSLGGTYEGVEPMGLLWSLRPVPGSKPGLRLRKTNVETPLEVTISVYQGHLSDDFPEHRALAAVPVERWLLEFGGSLSQSTTSLLHSSSLQCPLLFVVGQDDQSWPAYVSAKDIKRMMEKAGNSHLLTVLSYPDAGHLIEPPYSPHTRSSILRAVQTTELRLVLWDGQTWGHSRAQGDSWRKTLAFLREHLYGRRNTTVTSTSNP